MSAYRIFAPLVGVVALAGFNGAAEAAVFDFSADPFAGSDALTTPGRQIVANEASIPVFNFATDVLSFNSTVFHLPNGITTFNGTADNIPANGVNFVVLGTFDSDGNPANGNQLAAGTAANLIASRITTPSAGFFIYFNSALDLPRLVYSTDLSSNQADLKVLARFTGLGGAAGRAAMAQFAATNVASVPEPATWAMMIAGFGLVGAAGRRRTLNRVTA